MYVCGECDYIINRGSWFGSTGGLKQEQIMVLAHSDDNERKQDAIALDFKNGSHPLNLPVSSYKIYIYIYIERERERERDNQGLLQDFNDFLLPLNLPVSSYKYRYLYIYIYIDNQGYYQSGG